MEFMASARREARAVRSRVRAIFFAPLLCAAALVGSACSTNTAAPASTPSTAVTSSTTVTSTTTVVAPSCPSSESVGVIGTVANASITESSGVAASWRNDGVYWVHNDSGDSARVFAMSRTGADLGVFDVAGASAIDWEDIAVGPGPAGADSYLYVGDIGGNGGRSALVIYRIPEPLVDPAQPPGQGSLGGAVALPVQYPGGERHNAEALFVDPRNADIYVVTKAGNGDSRVFQYPAAAQTPGQTGTMVQVGARSIPGPGSLDVTGGDMAPDGGEIALRTYDRVFLWPVVPGGSVTDALAGEPCTVRVTGERQGEAVGYQHDGRNLILTSEGVSQPVRELARP